MSEIKITSDGVVEWWNLDADIVWIRDIDKKDMILLEDIETHLEELKEKLKPAPLIKEIFLTEEEERAYVDKLEEKIGVKVVYGFLGNITIKDIIHMQFKDYILEFKLFKKDCLNLKFYESVNRKDKIEYYYLKHIYKITDALKFKMDLLGIECLSDKRIKQLLQTDNLQRII